MTKSNWLVGGILVATLLIGAWWFAPLDRGAGEGVVTQSSEVMRGTFTLAASWQSAFCETAPRRPECQSQTDAREDAFRFSLHGLWPEPRGNEYCNVPGEIATSDRNGRWSDLPAVEISGGVWSDLEVIMPGTQSLLHRHEWIKHGTCAEVSPNEYYAGSVRLINALNASEVGTLFANNIGRALSADQIRSAFDRAFGRGAGARVTIECEREGGRTMIGELRISLVGEIGPVVDLGALILAAETRSRGCPAGEVDRAGIS